MLGVSTGLLREINQGKKQIPQGWNMRLFGSQALQLCYVAMGRLDASISVEAKAWDDVAAALIIEEAGGEYLSHELKNHSWTHLALNYTSMKSIGFSNSISENDKTELKSLIYE